MNITTTDLSSIPLTQLNKQQTIDADLEIARRIVGNDSQTVDYFLGRFSQPFLNYIGNGIMRCQPMYVNGVACYYPMIASEYYEFIGAAFANDLPTWHKIALYRGITNDGKRQARLYTYVSTITVRYFLKRKQKEDRAKEKMLKNNSVGMIENMDVSILLKYDGFDEIDLEKECKEESEFDWAWKQLSPKDRLILQRLVIEECEPVDAFDELIDFVDTQIPAESYTRKQRQNAMSLLKQRAKTHLRKLIVEYRKKRGK